jgi:hypothetical protein
MSTLKVASEIASASGALAGLILVFFAAALSSFDTYSVEQQGAVRTSYRWRAWPALIAFVLSLISCTCAIAALWTESNCLEAVAATLLAVAAVGMLISAIRAVLDIG